MDERRWASWVLVLSRTPLPPNSVLSSLVLGKAATDGPRWLVVGYKTNQGEEELELDQQEDALPMIIAPADHGGSGEIHVPQVLASRRQDEKAAIVSALQFGGQTLTVWYRRVVAPENFGLGPEEPGPGTKEPENNGEGEKATKEGYTITGFELQKDPDGTLELKLWYRQVRDD
jgi:hypothetical protein